MAINYRKIGWENRVIQRPRTYTETTQTDGAVTHTPSPGTVVKKGTPRSAENMDHMDQGIKDCADSIDALLLQVAQIESTLRDYRTQLENHERNITDIQAVDERQSGTLAILTEAHNELAEDEDALENRADGHIARRDNPHAVTKVQVGLDKVPNVTTNDQTPTFTEAGSNQNLVSGEKISTAFGKISWAIKQLWAHIARTDNPHGVTKAQVGLGNVPNVTTNNQTPTYSVASSDANLSSGETLAMAFGKLARAVSQLWSLKSSHEALAADEAAVKQSANSHSGRKDNPHAVTKNQIGLGNVPNVTTNDQTPTYSAAGSNQNLSSGEKLSTAFGKLARAVSQLWSHIGNTNNPHGITAAQIGAFRPVQGEWTGNGSASRSFDLGFQPMIVIWCDETGTFADDIKGTCGGIIYRGSPQYVWDIGYGSSARNNNTKVAEITSSGFTVFNGSTTGHTGRNSNHSGTKYHYIAW